MFVLSFARPIRFNFKKNFPKAGKKETHLLILQMVPPSFTFPFRHVKWYTNSAPHFFWGSKSGKNSSANGSKSSSESPRSPERDVRLDPNVRHFPWRWVFSQILLGADFQRKLCGKLMCFFWFMDP